VSDLFRHFVEAQDEVWPRMQAELRSGCKQSHWMWFIFPQIEGLGHSGMSRLYAIASLEDARAYLRHPLLGPRLNSATALTLDIEGRTAEQIFGHPDHLKFHSSTTLFAAADPEEKPFQAALDKYFGGRPDPLTLRKITR
jgi:uncharacterized protein (DUF1810 family)